MDCIFCEICKGKADSHIICENKHAIAFLDIRPINSGHVLVVPKKHVSDFYNLDEYSYNQTMKLVKEIAKLVNKVIQPKKVGLIIAGWDVPHTHVHVVPMQEYHDITSKSLLDEKHLVPSQDELKKVADQLRTRLKL